MLLITGQISDSYRSEWLHCLWGTPFLVVMGDLHWFLGEERSACPGSTPRNAADDIERLLRRAGLLLEFWISDTCFRDFENKPLGLRKLLSDMLLAWLLCPLSDGFSQLTSWWVDDGGKSLLFPLPDPDDRKLNSFFMGKSYAKIASFRSWKCLLVFSTNICFRALFKVEYYGNPVIRKKLENNKKKRRTCTRIIMIIIGGQRKLKSQPDI